MRESRQTPAHRKQTVQVRFQDDYRDNGVTTTSIPGKLGAISIGAGASVGTSNR
jgi:hypothetical protein